MTHWTKAGQSLILENEPSKPNSNIGKTQVLAVNVSTRKSVSLSRFASLPQKLEGNSNLMVVLNEDGSISWYNAKTNSLYANWYVTVDGTWIEY